MAKSSNTDSTVSMKDLMTLVEGLKAAGLGQMMNGQDLLSFNGPNNFGQVRAGTQIPFPAGRGVSQGEMGYAPSGIAFTGGSPHQLDFTGRRIQNAIFLADQLAKVLMKKKGVVPNVPAENSVMANQAPYGSDMAGIMDLLKGLR